MTVSRNLVEIISGFNEQLNDFSAETIDIIVGIESDREFCEVLAQLNLGQNNIAYFMGDLVWRRVCKKFGSDTDPENPDTNKSISMWSEWSGIEYHKMIRMVGAARNREIVPEISKLSITAQHEIGLGAGSGDIREEVISKRLGAVERIDPKLNSTTKAVRSIKAVERGGIYNPKLRYIGTKNGLYIEGLFEDDTYQWVATIEIPEYPEDMQKVATAYIEYILERAGIQETKT